MNTVEIFLEPADKDRLASLIGPYDDNIKHIERRMGVEVTYQGNKFKIVGNPLNIAAVTDVLKNLYIETQPNSKHKNKVKAQELTPDQVHLAVQGSKLLDQSSDSTDDDIVVRTRKGNIKPRNQNQVAYVRNVLNHDITFGIGPAGTGKTYLAVACAVDALERQEVRRILLTRPAVEAGEKLGFLPGDLSQKIDPYLRPLYDALFEMLGFEKVERLIERNVIEVAPLAYMRGRTLNDAFIILDESQNTTVEQMKMFLTRIGFNSKAVITGDITQIDLPRGAKSGLRQSIEVLSEVEDISFNFFIADDVVRHPVVAKVVMAYEKFDEVQRREKAERDKAWAEKAKEKAASEDKSND
ncbi:PhoH family protein [Psychrosphaera algicola]|uniref:PhoH family protein n=1 Tax=Psychrosphaera algicola TaxID=3023714 RepID=UPI00351D32F5